MKKKATLQKLQLNKERIMALTPGQQAMVRGGEGTQNTQPKPQPNTRPSPSPVPMPDPKTRNSCLNCNSALIVCTVQGE